MNIMNSKENNWERHYVSPIVQMIDISPESVFCSSAATIEDWLNDDDILDFD